MKYSKALGTFLICMLAVRAFPQEGHEPGSGALLEKPEFFALLELGSQTRERVITLEKSIRASEIIVRGYVDSVVEGRVLTNAKHPQIPPINTSFIKLEVTREIKGRTAQYVYIEYLTGGLSPAALHDSKYSGEVLVMLSPATGYYKQEDQNVQVFKSASTIVASNNIYQLTLPSRLFTTQPDERGNDVVVSPLGENALGEKFEPSVRSLDDLEGVIKGLL